MQVAVIEYARHICGMDDANSTEFDQKTTHPVISLQAVSYTQLDVYKRQGSGMKTNWTPASQPLWTP